MIAKLKTLLSIISIVAIVGTLFVAGWQLSSYARKAAEQESLATARAVKIETLEAELQALYEKQAAHNAEILRADAQSKKDRAYYADLKTQIEKFKHFAAAAPPPGLQPCHENPDPVLHPDLVRMHNDAIARLP